MSETKRPVLDKAFSFEADGKVWAIKMTFGLLTQLAKEFSTPEQFQLAYLDPDKLLDAVNICLAHRDEDGKVRKDIKQPNIRNMDIEVETYEKLVHWIYSHATDFFIRRTRAYAEVQRETKDEFLAILGSPDKSATG